MGLKPGDRIGPYEVVVKVGAGGMGEVFRGRDLRLDREVALKVLPDAVATDAERLARLAREAKTLAALNHPNIAQIYGLEDRALAMEFVEGEDLSVRIARGAVPVDEALQIAGQIAAALEAAHEFGVIHRDLKPSNVRVRADGVVKVLDFGLAKALAPPSAILDAASSPTITSPTLTSQGVILGTAAYMSPEQARGKEADKRADIWAFGVVLYEMTTGRRPFEGEIVTETLAGVLKSDPDWTPVPPEFRQLLRSCLEKDPKKRLRDIGDWRRELGRGGEGSTTSSRPWFWWGTTAAATVAAASIAVVHFGEVAPAPQPMRFEILPPTGNTLQAGLAVAPDGRHIAFTAKGADQVAQIWVRSLESLEASPVAGTEGGSSPLWSPDSRALAFVVGRALKRVPIEGGAAQTICEIPNVDAVGGGYWSRRGVIVFGGTRSGAIRTVPDSGGVPSPVTQVDASRREVVHGLVRGLPDDQHFLYTRVSNDPAVAGVYVGSLDLAAADQSLVRLIAASNATYRGDDRGSGHVLYLRQGALVAHAFDAARLALVGEPVQVATGVANFGAAGLFSADGGVIAYQTGAPGAGRGTELTWVDREGKPAGVVGEPGVHYDAIQLSPDGTRAAVQLRTTVDASLSNAEVWIIDLTRRLSEPRTRGDAFASSPIWSPGGDRIAFGSSRQGVGDIVVARADGSGTEEVLLSSKQRKTPTSWSRDGRFLLFHTAEPQSPADVWLLSLADRKAVPLLSSTFGESEARFSPDMKWIAYAADNLGRFQVYVRRFDPQSPTTLPGGAVRVSTGGGAAPRWTKNGRELIYRTGDDLMSVEIPEGAELRPREPKRLFTLVSPVAIRAYWDVAADGQRFLVTVPAAPARTAPITVLVNWRPPR